MKNIFYLCLFIPYLSHADTPHPAPYFSFDSDPKQTNFFKYGFLGENSLYTIDTSSNRLSIFDIDNGAIKATLGLSSSANMAHSNHLFVQEHGDLIRFEKDGTFKKIKSKMNRKILNIYSNEESDYVHASELIIRNASSNKPDIVKQQLDNRIVSRYEPYYGNKAFVELGMRMDWGYSLFIYDAMTGEKTFSKSSTEPLQAPKIHKNGMLSYIKNNSIILWDTKKDELIDIKKIKEKIKYSVVDHDEIYLFFEKMIKVVDLNKNKIHFKKQCQLEESTGYYDYHDSFSNENYFYVSTNNSTADSFIYQWSSEGCNKIAELGGNAVDYRMHPTKPIIARYDLDNGISLINFEPKKD